MSELFDLTHQLGKTIFTSIFYLLLFFIIMDRITPIRVDYKLNKEYFKSFLNDTLFILTNTITWKIFSLSAALFLINHVPPSPLQNMTSVINDLPVLIRALLVLFVTEFFGYWLHRAYHQIGFLWDIHKVHHSGQTLVWSHTYRMHFLQYIISATFDAILLYIILPKDLTGGSNLNIVFIISTITLFYTFLGHSNFHLTFGWFNRILASPQLHHWHHDENTYNKNFSGIFSIFDWAFGTLHLPQADQYPQRYGIRRKIKEDYFSLLSLPFIEWRRRINDRKNTRPNIK